MWESLDYQRRLSGSSRRIERLSDLLGWLASRGYRITVCVDVNRSKEEGVRSFLEKLKRAAIDAASLRILTKEIREGSMHIKGMVTPVGTIDGSANLTASGMQRNEESVNHANYGTNDYERVRTRLIDALHEARDWSGQ
jgi:hypothetical protein